MHRLGGGHRHRHRFSRLLAVSPERGGAVVGTVGMICIDQQSKAPKWEDYCVC